MELKQGFRAAHRNRSVEVHIVTDVWFTGMVISRSIQLVFNSSVAIHIVTDVLFTGIYTMQHILVSGCSKYIKYKHCTQFI